jgi:maltose/moltooligosaccharide transporter
LIGFGAVIGSAFPYILTKWFAISNEAPIGKVPLNLTLSFIFGAAILIGSILVTLFSAKEYSPEEMAKFDDEKMHQKAITDESSEKDSKLSDIFTDFRKMPTTMKQLSWVQFFSWFGLFGMWVFTTPAIAHHTYGLSLEDHSSKQYQDAGDWVGILFGVYNLVSALVALFVLPVLAKKFGRITTHSICLIIGGLGLISIYFMPNENWIIASMICVGFAWASILAMPYAILAGAIAPKKMGVYMGIFNFFIVIPQIINAIIGGPIVEYLYNGNAIYALITSGVSFIIAAVLVYKVKDNDEEKTSK